MVRLPDSLGLPLLCKGIEWGAPSSVQAGHDHPMILEDLVHRPFLLNGIRPAIELQPVRENVTTSSVSVASPARFGTPTYVKLESRIVIWLGIPRLCSLPSAGCRVLHTFRAVNDNEISRSRQVGCMSEVRP